MKTNLKNPLVNSWKFHRAQSYSYLKGIDNTNEKIIIESTVDKAGRRIVFASCKLKNMDESKVFSIGSQRLVFAANDEFEFEKDNDEWFVRVGPKGWSLQNDIFDTSVTIYLYLRGVAAMWKIGVNLTYENNHLV